MQKQQIDIGVREEPAATKTAGCHQREIPRTLRAGGDDLAPQPQQHGIDQGGAAGECGTSVTCGGKFLLDGSGFLCVQVP